jgi:hypothetical protein
MLVKRVVGERTSRVGGRGKDVLLAANDNDVGGVTTSSTLRVVAVEGTKHVSSVKEDLSEREGCATDVWIVRPLKAAMVLSTKPARQGRKVMRQ